jgi:Flp pilus assembly protein TadB
MIRLTDQYFWNIIFGIFFLCFLVMGTIILETEHYRDFATLTVLDYVIMALASHRLVRLFVYDAITKFFREQFYNAEVNKRGEVVLFKPQSGPRRTLADLMSCPWCFGIWAAATVAFFYLLTPYAFFPIMILALSSVASTLQVTTNLLGHKAEQLKRQNEELS